MTSGILRPIANDRPAEIISVDLGQNGAAYIQAALRNAGHLSECVAPILDRRGLSIAPVEKGTDFDKSQHFSEGMNMPTKAIRQWMADYISSHWGESAQIIFEDVCLTKSDVGFRAPDQFHFFAGKTLYFVPQSGSMLVRLTSGENEVTSHSFAAFVIAPPTSLPPIAENMPTQDQKLLAQNVRAVLLSAYDREGYIMWQTASGI